MAGLSPKNPTIYKGPNVYIAEIVARDRAPTGTQGIVIVTEYI